MTIRLSNVNFTLFVVELVRAVIRVSAHSAVFDVLHLQSFVQEQLSTREC